jgi:hypothetical protein
MTAMELLTAVRERVPLTVMVFNDGYYGLIRKQQMGVYGHAHGTTLSNPDIGRIAESCGARYVRLERAPGGSCGTRQEQRRYRGRGPAARAGGRRVRQLGRGLASH